MKFPLWRQSSAPATPLLVLVRRFQKNPKVARHQVAQVPSLMMRSAKLFGA